jgi:hypothetical protein
MEDLKQPFVYVGDSIEALELNSCIYCDMLSMKTAPDMSQAVLTYEYGRMAKQIEGGGFRDYPSQDLRGKYIQLKMDEKVLFNGYVGSQADQPLGTFKFGENSAPTGTNKFFAFDFIFMLDRIYVDCSYLIDKFTYRNFPFNGSSGRLTKNRSKDKTTNPDTYYFNFSSEAKLWTALDIVEYLLAYFADCSGFVWELSGYFEYLQHYTPQLDPDGKTVRQCLNEIIRPEYGFTYLTEVSEGKVYLKIVSISDQNIEYNSSIIIPANDEIIELENAIEESRKVDNVQITQVDESAYSKIRVYSEPVRMTSTYKLGTADGGMEKAWSDSLALEYKDSEEEDRKKDKYDPAYCRFKLTENWDQFDYEVNEVIPAVDENDCSIEFWPDNIYVANAYAFDRTLPIRVDPSDPKSEYKKPILFLKDENDKYFIADKNKDSETPTIGLTVLDDFQGIQINTPYPHILGKNHFEGNSDYIAAYDYEDCLATLSFYTDAVLAYTVGDAAESGIVKTKHINAPGYHLWLAAPKTMLDVDEILPENDYTVYRDDREELKKLAVLARAWYGRRRNTLSFTINNMTYLGCLGAIVSSLYSGGSFTPIGTPITSVDYDFLQQSITISTDFEDINLVSISGRYLRNSEKATAKRLTRIEDSIRNIPVRSQGSMGGGSSEVYVKLKTKVDYETYTADMYRKRTQIDPSESDVTVKVNLISEDETIPFLNTVWSIYRAKKEPWSEIPEGETESVDVVYWTVDVDVIRGG